MTWTLPTVAGIQRATIIVAAIVALALALTVSFAAALSTVLGAAVMMVNLYLLAILGRWILALGDQGGAGGALGMVLAPFKMVLIIGAVYLLISSGRVNLPGFGAGLLTQFAAVFIETWRVSARSIIAHPQGRQEDQRI
ncbi:MAG: hypothetical protein ABSG46_05460 [Candidatus Binataceae bacterium]|jgi:hypothetical protein